MESLEAMVVGKEKVYLRLGCCCQMDCIGWQHRVRGSIFAYFSAVWNVKGITSTSSLSKYSFVSLALAAAFVFSGPVSISPTVKMLVQSESPRRIIS